MLVAPSQRTNRIAVEEAGASAKATAHAASARAEGLLQQGADAIAVGAAGGQPRAVVENDDIVTFDPRLDFANALDVDDRRAMNTDESRAESRLDMRHGLAQYVRRAAGVNLHRIVRRVDPIDLA